MPMAETGAVATMFVLNETPTPTETTNPPPDRTVDEKRSGKDDEARRDIRRRIAGLAECHRKTLDYLSKN